MTYLLDTNVCIQHLKSPAGGPIAARLATVQKGDIVLCSIVAAELLYGAIHSRSVRNLQRTTGFLALFRSLPFDDGAARLHAESREHLARQGLPVGHNDLMIAAIALANNLTVVTHNVAEFSRIPGLHVEDWQTTP